MRWKGGAAPSPQPPSSFFTSRLGWPPLQRNQPQQPQPQPLQQQPSTHNNHNNHNDNNSNNNNNNKMLVHQRMRWVGGAAPSPPTPVQLFYFTFRLASLQRTRSGYVRFDISSPCWGGGAAPSPPTFPAFVFYF